VFELLASELLVVGRAPPARLVIPHSTVSTTHADLQEESGDWFVRDRGSTNGTTVNGAPLEKGSPLQLQDGARVRFGTGPELELVAAPRWAKLLEVERGKAPAARPPRPDETLMVKCDGVAPLRLSVGAELVVGRTSERAQLVLDHEQVSRAHAKLSRTADGLSLVDLGSANGTFLDGVRLGATPVSLGVGAAFQVGPFRIVVEAETTRKISWPPRFAKGG
jgi:pSer/pThr/pTyr-binding forkhead associated (FHA) protein